MSGSQIMLVIGFLVGSILGIIVGEQAQKERELKTNKNCEIYIIES